MVDPLTGDAMPVGAEGELCVHGPQLMAGYLNRPEATAATFDREGALETRAAR